MKIEEMFSPEKRVKLRSKLKQALEADVSSLSTEMKQILYDDLVTALQNRLIVLAQS